jgi:hypothetical protein
VVPEQTKSSVAEVRRGSLDDATRHAYAKLLEPKYDTTGGLGTLESCLAGAELFEVVHQGETVTRYALKTVDRANGAEVYIAAAVGGLAGVDLVESIVPVIEQQCAFADCLTINTKRRGLIKKLLKQGWTMECAVLRKKLK